MKKGGLILLLLLLVLFGYGMSRLFRLRFEAGDIYPAYSSLHADPLGTKAFHDSLNHLIPAERNYRALLRIDRGVGQTLFVLGTDLQQLYASQADVRDLEQFVMTGGRLVLAFHPVFTRGEIYPRLSTNQVSIKGKSRDDLHELGIVSLQDRWHFKAEFTPLSRNDEGVYQPALAQSLDRDDLPKTISCHTALTLEALDPAWTTLFERTNASPVIMERKLGNGSIALSADSYLFSNEALLKDRQTSLLAWFTGDARTAIFDETHLGVEEHRGVATLARKYRLHGFVAGFALLIVLFFWRSSSSLVPPRPEQSSEAGWVQGQHSAAGFSNLLRRNIPVRALLATCIQEWNRSCRSQTPLPRLEKMQAVIDAENSAPASNTNPVRTYREIASLLSRSTRAPAKPDSRS